jgi:hypothetical protein
MGRRAERGVLREDAARLLGELGGTAGEVAYALYLTGVRVPRAASGQPSTVSYLHAVMGGDPRVSQVTVTKRWLIIRTPHRWRSIIRVRLPRAVRLFTASVDRPRAQGTIVVRVEDESS